ncbi:MAG: glycosyltransferase family 2 protein [Paracoccaceae bacterium]
MNAPPAVSLIVVSHSRPASLERLLRSLRYQTLRPFQLVVVADRRPKISEPFDFVGFAGLNISAARNLGVARARAEVVAFCDDDCIPEPVWLERLTAPFSDPAVGAAGGFVRGRNGVCFQSKAVMCDRNGHDFPLPVAAGEPWTCPETPDGFAVKTVGTNCAFRRAALVGIGGFDSGFRFYLEEVDVDFRLAGAGWRTAVVPGAQVQHERHAGPHRTESGAPRNLREIGASHARFLAKHGRRSEMERELAGFRRKQEGRLRRFVSDGRLTSAAAKKLAAELQAGMAEGPVRRQQSLPRGPAGQGAAVIDDTAPFGVTLIARPFRRRLARRLAGRLAEAGIPVTLIDFRPGARRLRVRFTGGGYWLHRGGTFGRVLRDEPVFRLATTRQRGARESERMADSRRTVMVREVDNWTLAACLNALKSRSLNVSRAGRNSSESAIRKKWGAASISWPIAIVSPQSEI